jgi:hypothetical protein
MRIVTAGTSQNPSSRYPASATTEANAPIRLPYEASQFSTTIPATCTNSDSLFVTEIQSSFTACAAMSRSLAPLGRPADSSIARTSAYARDRGIEAAQPFFRKALTSVAHAFRGRSRLTVISRTAARCGCLDASIPVVQIPGNHRANLACSPSSSNQGGAKLCPAGRKLHFLDRPRVSGDYFISRKQRNSFYRSLGNKNSVERVLMQSRQTFEANDVLTDDGQFAIAVV